MRKKKEDRFEMERQGKVRSGIKDLILEITDLQAYLKDSWEKLKNETATIARLGVGSEIRTSSYWREVDDKKCVMKE